MNAYFLKKELRAKIREKRTAFDPEERALQSGEILKNLYSLPEYQNAKTILTYVSTDVEVDTFPLIENAVQSNKRVAVPRCIEGKPLIDFYYIEGAQALEHGSYGLLEPAAQPEKKYDGKSGGLCIVPGLSFDRKGMRLGYGRGYYDRFLQNFKGITVGVCFSGFLSARPLPAGRFDFPVSIVVTDRQIIRCR